MTASPSQCQPNPVDELDMGIAALMALGALVAHPATLNALNDTEAWGLSVLVGDVTRRLTTARDIVARQRQTLKAAARAAPSPLTRAPLDAAPMNGGPLEGGPMGEQIIRALTPSPGHANAPTAEAGDEVTYPRLDAMPGVETVRGDTIASQRRAIHG